MLYFSSLLKSFLFSPVSSVVASFPFLPTENQLWPSFAQRHSRQQETRKDKNRNLICGRSLCEWQLEVFLLSFFFWGGHQDSSQLPCLSLSLCVYVCVSVSVLCTRAYPTSLLALTTVTCPEVGRNAHFHAACPSLEASTHMQNEKALCLCYETGCVMGALLHGFWPDVTGDLKPTSPQGEGAKWLSDFTCLLTDTQKLLYTQGGVTFSCEQADPFLFTFPTAKAFIKQAIDVTFDLQWLVLSRCQELMEARVDIWALLMFIDSTAYIEKVIRRAKSRGSKGERESVTSLLWASERELILELVVLVRAHTVRIYWLIAQSLFISSSSLGLHPQVLSPSFPCTHVLTCPFIHLPQFLDGFFILVSFLLFLTVPFRRTHRGRR